MCNLISKHFVFVANLCTYIQTWKTWAQTCKFSDPYLEIKHVFEDAENLRLLLMCIQVATCYF